MVVYGFMAKHKPWNLNAHVTSSRQWRSALACMTVSRVYDLGLGSLQTRLIFTGQTHMSSANLCCFMLCMLFFAQK